MTESAAQSIVLSVPEDLKVPSVHRWSAGWRSPREQLGVAGPLQWWLRRGMGHLRGAALPAGGGEPSPLGRAAPVPFLSLENPSGGPVQVKGERARG